MARKASTAAAPAATRRSIRLRTEAATGQTMEPPTSFIAWVQFRSELPLEAAKTAYATVVAKRDRRTYKATKSGVVFVFDEQAKVYESYYKAQLKNANTKSGKPSDDEERALEGKTSVAAATKALAQQKRARRLRPAQTCGVALHQGRDNR